MEQKARDQKFLRPVCGEFALKLRCVTVQCIIAASVVVEILRAEKLVVQVATGPNGHEVDFKVVVADNVCSLRRFCYGRVNAVLAWIRCAY